MGKKLTIHPLLQGVPLFMGWNINAGSREGDSSVSISDSGDDGGPDFAWGEKVMNTDVKGGEERRIPGDGKQTLTKLGNQGLNE